MSGKVAELFMIISRAGYISSCSLLRDLESGIQYATILVGLGVGPERVSKLLRSHCTFI